MNRNIIGFLLTLLMIVSSVSIGWAQEAQTPSPQPAESATESPSLIPSTEPTPETSWAEPTEPSATTEPVVSPEQLYTVTVSHTGGRIEREGEALQGNTVTLRPEEELRLKVQPESGYAFQSANFEGVPVLHEWIDDKAVLLTLRPAQDGMLDIQFVRRKTVSITLSGSASLAYSFGTEKGEGVAGDVLTFPEGEQITFLVHTASGSIFDRVEFNGTPVETRSGETGNTFQMTATESGTLRVHTTEASWISTILSNCSLLMQENGTWVKVKDGASVVTLEPGARKKFAIEPRSSYILKTLLVDGAEVKATKSPEGLYTFSVAPHSGETVITAVCQIAKESVDGIDPKTGLRYTLPGSEGEKENNITEDSWITVVPVTSGPIYDQAQTAASSYGQLLCVYDLKLHNADGRYEPDVPITVSIPIPDTYQGGRLKVLHESDNMISELPYRTEIIQGIPCVTIFTDSFSLYMLVDAPEEIVAPAVTSSEPTSGGHISFVWIVVGAVVIAIAAGYMLRRHRKQTVH